MHDKHIPKQLTEFGFIAGVAFIYRKFFINCYSFYQCQDKVANLLSSVLLELKKLAVERRNVSFTKYQTKLLQKSLI